MAKRDHQPRRRPSVRPERTTILIFCGGISTEPAYLDGLRFLLRDGSVALQVKPKNAAPEALIKHAAELLSQKQNRGFYEAVWCVVDVNEFDILSAVAIAEDAGIQVAVSNPCFELWLLLHCAPQTGSLENCGKTVEKLKKALPNYDKTRLKFVDFTAGIADAIERGKQLDPTGEDYKRNPSTGMWRLVERIIQ